MDYLSSFLDINIEVMEHISMERIIRWVNIMVMNEDVMVFYYCLYFEV